MIALTHHEKWDGSGYPRGLAGRRIPLAGCITAICGRVRRPDDADGRTRSPSPLDKAFAILREDRAKHFHPDVADAFFSIEAEVMRIRQDESDETESALFRLSRMAGGDIPQD